MQKIIFILLCLFYFFRPSSYGQVEISLANKSIENIRDIWNINIESTERYLQNVYVSISIRENSKMLYDCRSRLFPLHLGFQTYSLEILQPLQVNLDMLEEAPLMNRSIDILIKLFASDHTLIGEYRYFGKSSVPQADLKSKSKKIPNVKFSGNAKIEGQFSDRRGYGSMVPRNYGRAELYPNLTIASIPIGLDVLLSSEQSSQNQSLNQIAFRFDASQFKHNMQNLLNSNIKEIESGGNLDQLTKISKLKTEEVNKKFPKLQNWEQQLDQQRSSNYLEKLAESDRIKMVLKNPDIKQNRKRFRKLANKKGSLTAAEQIEIQSLISFDGEIRSLEAKQSELKKYKSLGKKYEKLSKKVQSARKFSKESLIHDPKTVVKGLKEFNLMNKWQNLLTGCENLTLGNSFPYYSKLSLNSLAINGVHIQYNPGKFYFETNYGQSAREALNTIYTIPQLTLPQRTFALKAGIGGMDDNHWHFCLIDIRDHQPKSPLNMLPALKQNRVIGSDAKLLLFKGHIELKAEIVGSLFTKDLALKSNGSLDYNFNAIPMKFLFPNNANSSSIFDYACSVDSRIKLFENGITILANYERIGPNFYNMGSPTLIRNISRWKTEIRQSIWNRKIAFSILAKEDNNNLNPMLSTVQSNSRYFGFNCTVNIPKWPVFVFSYAPYSQSNKVVAGGQDFDVSNRTWNAMLNYPLKLTSEIMSQTSLQFVQQSQNSNIPGAAFNYQMLGVNQSFQLRQGSISIAFTYTPKQIVNNVSQQLITLDGNCSVFLFKKWNNQLGLQYFDLESSESRLGFYWSTEYLVVKDLSIELRLQRNLYENRDASKEFMDFYGLGGIKYSW